MIGPERLVGEPADDALRRDRLPDRHRGMVTIGHPASSVPRRSATSSSVVPLERDSPIVRDRSGASEGRRDPGERPEAARLLLDLRRRADRVGHPASIDRLGACGRLLWCQRSPEDASEERGHGPAIDRELVEPRVLAALDLGDSIGCRAARRLGPAASGAWPVRPRPHCHERGGSERRSGGAPRTPRCRRRDGRVAGDTPGSSARRADRRSRRGTGDGRAGTSGGSGAMGRPVRGRDDGGDARLGSSGEDRPDRAHRVTEDRAVRHLGPGTKASKVASGVGAELAGADRQRLGRVGAVPADVDRRGSEIRRHGGRRRFGSVRSRADSQPWTRATPGPGGHRGRG